MNSLDRNEEAVREIVSSAVRFWERNRLPYNLALSLVVIIQVCLHWTAFPRVPDWSALRMLFNLAVLANVFYCAAYLPDFIGQFSRFRPQWLAIRWAILVIGILFACSLAWDGSQGLIGRFLGAA